MKIELITKKDYKYRIYVKDEKLKYIISSLNKKKTLEISDIENFKKLGIEFSLYTPENPLTKILN